MISLDTETTGVDFYHGAKPFFVTTCNEEGEQRYWQWSVNPFTREPSIPEEDLEEIRTSYVNASLGKALNLGPMMVLQNAKFDVRALASIGLTDWNWNRTYDTLLAGHLLASNHKHDLTSMAIDFLGENIEEYELNLEQCVKEARRLVRTKDFIERHGEWMIAKEGLVCMPSAKESTWKYDIWLPRAVAIAEDYDEDHPWWTVLSTYANWDSAVTLALIKRQIEEIKKRGLWKIYLERLKILPAVYAMEQRGVSLSGTRLEELVKEYTEDSGTAAAILCNIAESYGCKLQLPKGASPNNSLREFMFGYTQYKCMSDDCNYETKEILNTIPQEVCPLCQGSMISVEKKNLALPQMRNPKAKTEAPTLNKVVLDHYEATLPERSKPLVFVQTLKGKRSRDTAIAYMLGYKKFWIGTEEDGYYVIHPSVNPTGTDTLRSSSSNPNEQNISKKESFNLRYCFGPLPGRVWYSADYENLELRIPAFDAGETEMINLFLKPKDPPYFGSYHLLIFDTLHPEKFAKHGKECKTVYEATWYQWTKNGNFAVQYGAQEASGTADRAYHVPGAQRRIQSRFTKIKQLADRMMQHATKYGYVTTMPDKSIDPDHGYPLLCTRTQWGKILPTVPLSYRVQGTACQLKNRALVKCHAQLQEWREKEGFDAYIVMDVHDELVFDFPASTSTTEDTNLPKISILRKIMESCGDDIGVPTPVGIERHDISWDIGVKL